MVAIRSSRGSAVSLPGIRSGVRGGGGGGSSTTDSSKGIGQGIGALLAFLGMKSAEAKTKAGDREKRMDQFVIDEKNREYLVDTGLFERKSVDLWDSKTLTETVGKVQTADIERRFTDERLKREGLSEKNLEKNFLAALSETKRPDAIPPTPTVYSTPEMLQRGKDLDEDVALGAYLDKGPTLARMLAPGPREIPRRELDVELDREVEGAEPSPTALEDAAGSVNGQIGLEKTAPLRQQLKQFPERDITQPESEIPVGRSPLEAFIYAKSKMPGIQVGRLNTSNAVSKLHTAALQPPTTGSIQTSDGRILSTKTTPFGETVTGFSPKDSVGLVFKPVPDPNDPSKSVQAFINPRSLTPMLVTDENGKPVPWARPPIEINIGKKLELKTLQDLRDEHELALTNIRTFGQIANDYNPSFMTSWGKNVKLGGSAFLDSLGLANPLDPGYEFLQNATTFFQGVDQAFFVYRKFITGVAGGELEMKRIEDAFINRNQGPKAFEAALARMQRLYKDTADISLKSIEFVENKTFTLAQAQKYRAAQVEALLLRNGIRRKAKTKTSDFDSAVNSLSINLGE